MRFVHTWFPSPLLSSTLFVGWLMLNASLSTGHLSLALLLAVAIPPAVRRWRPATARPKHPGVALRLLVRVLVDIVTANIEVARQVLGPESTLRPGWVWVPLELRDPHAIAMLAAIVTLTPGTVSSEVADDHRHLLVHALHLDDPAALVASIKTRYETPLKAIFE